MDTTTEPTESEQLAAIRKVLTNPEALREFCEARGLDMEWARWILSLHYFELLKGRN